MEHSGVSHRDDQGADRVRARRRPRAARARSGVPVSPHRAGARRRRIGHHGPADRDARAGRDSCRSCRYRPLGRRGLGFGMAHDRYTGGAARAEDERRQRGDSHDRAHRVGPRASTTPTRSSPRRALDLGWLGHYDLSDSLGCAENFDDPRYLRRRSAADRAARPRRRCRWAGWSATGDGASGASSAAFAASASATKSRCCAQARRTNSASRAKVATAAA